MPTYEYECKTCSYNFEVFQAMSDEPIKICPQCGNAVRRLIFGGAGVIFKGSGFYVTDTAGGKNKRKEPETSKVSTKPAEPASAGNAAAASAGTNPPSSPAATPKTGEATGTTAAKTA